VKYGNVKYSDNLLPNLSSDAEMNRGCPVPKRFVMIDFFIYLIALSIIAPLFEILNNASLCIIV
jgi:hypothetical protein